MNIIASDIPDVLMIEPRVFEDERGYFFESYRENSYSSSAIGAGFKQDNVSFSKRDVLRGLHIQQPRAQGKLIQVLFGEIFDVAVDVRWGSPWFGNHVSVELTQGNKLQFYIPPGFAHGFCVTSDSAIIQYKCTEYYAPTDELTLLWDDPDMGILWPITAPLLSKKDLGGLRLRDVDRSSLPVFVPK